MTVAQTAAKPRISGIAVADSEYEGYRTAFDECFPQVYAFAWGCLRSRRPATDLVVEAFADVLPHQRRAGAERIRLAVLREAARRLSESGSRDKKALLIPLVFDAGLRLIDATAVLEMPLAAARRALVAHLRDFSR